MVAEFISPGKIEKVQTNNIKKTIDEHIGWECCYVCTDSHKRLDFLLKDQTIVRDVYFGIPMVVNKNREEEFNYRNTMTRPYDKIKSIDMGHLVLERYQESDEYKEDNKMISTYGPGFWCGHKWVVTGKPVKEVL